jgi:hypothetical protein
MASASRSGRWRSSRFADIAVLGPLDNQTFGNEADAFESFCEATTPIPVAKGKIRGNQAFPVRVLNADGQWVSGMAELFEDASRSIWIVAEKEIKSGASGGPVLNERGELVAIVSHSSRPGTGVARNQPESSDGLYPRPLKALPVWVCKTFLG